MTESERSNHLQVGVITRPHGVRGELKIRLHFEESQALFEVSSVVLEPPVGPAKRFEVESVRGSEKAPILALAGVVTREGADALRSATIWVERSALPPLVPGEYYLVDLVGCRVFCGGDSVGCVQGVRPDPSVDTMILKLDDGSTGEIPIVDAWVGAVDVQAGRVELRSLDGLIRE